MNCSQINANVRQALISVLREKPRITIKKAVEKALCSNHLPIPVKGELELMLTLLGGDKFDRRRVKEYLQECLGLKLAEPDNDSNLQMTFSEKNFSAFDDGSFKLLNKELQELFQKILNGVSEKISPRKMIEVADRMTADKETKNQLRQLWQLSDEDLKEVMISSSLTQPTKKSEGTFVVNN